jgi:tripartite-type tricarboxylate transporter receptor subunit TctC
MKLLLSFVLLLSFGSAGAAYPDKPVKVVQAFAAGGGSDILLRAILPKFSEYLGQPVVPDYRTGANGNLAMEAVARSSADGYTLLMGFPGLAVNPSLYDNMTVQPLRDFAPVGLIGSVPNVLVVHPSVPADSVRQLVELLKKQPGKLNYASPGSGSTQHLAAELFRLTAGVEMTHIPYKGGGQAQTDVVGGQAQMMFNVLPSALPMVRAGKLKALAVADRKRSAALPDVPTMIESGVAGHTATTWNGLLAPAGTPREVVAKLNDALVRALRTQETAEALAKLGQDIAPSTPEEFGAFLREETEKWQKVIKATGVKAQ